jgi:hypothetical protein
MITTEDKTITLAEVQSAQRSINEMIANLVKTAGKVVIFASAKIDLREDEHYAGIIVGKKGEQSHHVILLPGEAGEVKWEAAGEWAIKAGGELPTRREQALLYANLKDQFQGAWYWSSEQHAGISDYAWCQDFSNGYQGINHEGNCLRGRAIRRLVIE